MAYPYERLDFSRFETRLLYIAPVDSGRPQGEPVSCWLDTISLIEAPQYSALSYCWGDPQFTTPIKVAGHAVRVTVKLDAALRELRDRRITAIWVDALCINQADLYERSQQVLQMGNIYSGASKVYAWLGPSSLGTDEAIGTLEQLSAGENLTGLTRDTLQSIFRRPFWRRVWIIQEMAKPPQVEFVLGDRSFTWIQLRSSLRNRSLLQFLYQDQLQLLTGLDDFRERERSNQAMPLCTALVRSSGSLASEPRDKLFALLGLVSDGNKIIPLPNYLQPVDEILYSAVQRMITDQKRLAIILLATRRAGRTARNPSGINEEALPSWFPNMLNIAQYTPPWVVTSTENNALDGDVEIRMSREILNIPIRRISQIQMIMRMPSDSPEQSSLGELKGYNDYGGIVMELFHALTWYKFIRLMEPDTSLRIHAVDGSDNAVTFQSTGFRSFASSVFASIYLGKTKQPCPDALRRWFQANEEAKLGDQTLKQILQSASKMGKMKQWLFGDRHSMFTNIVIDGLAKGERCFTEMSGPNPFREGLCHDFQLRY